MSHKSARKAEQLGFTNVKVFAGGLPAWTKAGNYLAVGIEEVYRMVGSDAPYILVDSRPANKFVQGHIPSSISIPDTQFEAKAGMLPSDRSLPIVFYCGGYDCKLSHKSADKAKNLGYTNVMVAESGYPAWKEAYGASDTAVAVQTGEMEGAIDLAQFEDMLENNPESMMLIDVRDADEFAAGHLPGAVNIPVDQLEDRIPELPADKPVVFVCSTGARSGESYYMVQDVRPELEDVYYVEANISCPTGGGYTITPPE
ncbi:MAG: rhodanese-like domain-containing protein [Desulfovibrionales bacterium]